MSFNQLAPTVPTILNCSNCFVFSNSSTGNALSVQQLGAGPVFRFSNAAGLSNVMVMDANGRVGVGTASPATALDVRGTTGLIGDEKLGGTTGNQSNVIVQIGNGSSAFFGALKIIGTRTATGVDWGTSSLRIQKYVDVTQMGYMEFGALGGIQDIAFGTGGTTERMRITNGGNVGIGTTNPGYLLDISGGDVRVQTGGNVGGAGGAINFSANIGYGPMSQIKGALDTAAGSVNDQGSVVFLTRPVEVSPFTVRTTLTERMRITSIGNVGIGNASPTAPLHVGDGTAYQGGTATITKLALMDSTVATNGTVNIQIGKAGSTYDSFFIAHNNVGASSASNYVGITAYNGNTVMALQAQGRVGIGVTNPSYPLHVATTLASPSVAGRWFNFSGGLNTTTQSFNTSIYSAASVMTSDVFVAISDERAKVLEESPSESYMDLVDKIHVHQYSWINKIEKGSTKKIGFFAQEVEKIVPDAVGHTTAIVPTIYRQANAFTESTITVMNHGITTEKKLEIVDPENGKTKIDIVRVIDVHNLEVKFEKVPKDKLFVVGPEVDDSRVLNHDHLMAVGFGGLKELHALVNTQQTTIEMLTERLAALEGTIGSRVGA